MTSTSTAAMSTIPTGEIRRSRMLTTSLGVSTLLVTSAPTTSSSMIPTGVRVQSPRTGWDASVYTVLPSGDVESDGRGYGYVYDDSYGKNSPRTAVTSVAYSVYPDGDVYTGYDDGVNGSYGI